MENFLQRSIEDAGRKAQYDANAKKLLSQKLILAHILKGTTQEFATMELKEIVSCIEGEPKVSSVRVEPGKTNASYRPNIRGSNTEQEDQGEGKIYFDILFYVRMKDGLSRMIINIEAQQKEKPGYPLIHRAIFYGCRMISSQKERDFVKSNYGDMNKTYSIWICFNLEENCMNRLHMVNTPIFGTHRWEGDEKLLNIILVGISKNLTEETLNKTKSELHFLLGTIFSGQLTGTEKIRLLSKKEGIIAEKGLREELTKMFNFSDVIEERGIEKGIEKGKETALFELVKKKYTKGQSVEKIAEDLEEVPEVIRQIIQKIKETEVLEK